MYKPERQEFTVETATPYFTNVPQTYHVLYNRDAANNFDGRLFNMEVLTDETPVDNSTVKESGSSAINVTDRIITVEDITGNYRLYSPSSANLPFRTGYEVVSREQGRIAVDITLYFSSKLAEQEMFEVQPVYDLVLLVRPGKKHVGSAAMKMTIVIQQSKVKRILILLIKTSLINVYYSHTVNSEDLVLGAAVVMHCTLLSGATAPPAGACTCAGLLVIEAPFFAYVHTGLGHGQ